MHWGVVWCGGWGVESGPPVPVGLPVSLPVCMCGLCPLCPLRSLVPPIMCVGGMLVSPWGYPVFSLWICQLFVNAMLLCNQTLAHLALVQPPFTAHADEHPNCHVCLRQAWPWCDCEWSMATDHN